MSNIPKLRFPEFTDAWEKCKLGEVAEIVGGGTPDTNNANYWDGDIDWYSPTEIGEDIYVSGSLKKISQLGLERSSAKLLPEHRTILFTSRASIGDMAILLKSGTTNQGFQSFVVNEKKANVYFLYSLGFKIKNFALKNATGSTFLEISKKQLEKMEIPFPTLPEQQKIGNLFKQLDRLITLHKRKWDDVILLKKALLQKMFPKNGSDFPEIRFPEFTDAWEKCKVGEVANPQQWKTLSSKEMTESGYPVFGANGYIGFYSEYNHEKETIAITCRGATSGSITLVQAKSYITGNSMAIDDLNENICIQDFLLFSLISRGLKDIVSGSAQPQIVKKAIDQVTISYPSLPEQQKIGNLFKQLDRLITLHKRQHEHYQLLKKALLQQMFV